MNRLFGNYEILRKIATGGMAEIFLAKHRGLGGFERLVCIKRILPHLSAQQDFVNMFQDEARIVANLVHPNVAQIYDIGNLDGIYYIAMEYVRGEDLRRIYNQEVARGRAMPLDPAAHIAMGAAAGLDHAHRHTSIDGKPLGIVHRDVSPQNILVTYDGHVKLVDFGVAKAEGKLAETRAGVLKGKYSYMSPEQASGDPIDGRTDVFALAITLYEVTTGVRLFKRESEIETLHAVIECKVTPPGELVPGYDQELEEIVQKALSHNPDDRFQTAGEFERALEKFLIRRNHPTSAAALGAYMQELFAEKLADELLFGGQPWDEQATPISNKARQKSEHKNSEHNSEPKDELASANNETQNDDNKEDATEIEDSARMVRLAKPDFRQTERNTRDDWETAAESVSKTTTHDPREAAEIHTGPKAQATKHGAIARWFTGWTLAALIALAIGIAAVVFLVTFTQQRNFKAGWRSGSVSIDSEPRGARVTFVGRGAEALNRRYETSRTPFTINEGLPVESKLQLKFSKEGYEVALLNAPTLQHKVVPELLFVELSPVVSRSETGTLVVLSQPPGAEIFIDGNKMSATTPAEDLRVRGGEMHRVELKLPGFKPRWEPVYVEPGAKRFVELKLSPLTDQSDQPVPTNIAIVAEEAEADSANKDNQTKIDPGTQAASDRGRGFLTITSPLKLKVTVDNRPVGDTPIRRLAVESGTRRIRLQSEEEGFIIRKKVRLSAGLTETLDIRPRKGRLALNATPWAWIRIGKAPPTETPVRLQIYEGEYSILFECPDGKRKTETAKVNPNQTASVSVNCQE